MRQSCHRLLEHQHAGGEEPPLYSPIDQISGKYLYSLVRDIARDVFRRCQHVVEFILKSTVHIIGSVGTVDSDFMTRINCCIIPFIRSCTAN